MRRGLWIGLGGVGLLFVAAALGVYLLSLGSGEVRRWEFEASLLPTLQTHLQETNQYDANRFRPSKIGRFALGRDMVPETSCTLLEGDSGILVVTEIPSTSSVPCVWYDKETGEYSRLIVAPWR